MHKLKRLLAERLAVGLKRSSITSCSRWAENYRIMDRPFPGKWTFIHHPWLREMHDSIAERNVGQKSAQMGYTETALNIVFYSIDVLRIDCLYILPAKTPDAGDFSAARFDPALELSPHLETLFSDVKNVGHKRAGTTNLYIRGSKSRAGLKSVPVGRIILDEIDEMTQANIPLAWERMAGQTEKMEWKFSTPTIENYGVNKYYKESSQEHFFFRCPNCASSSSTSNGNSGRITELVFPECLVITAENAYDPTINDSYLICKECKNKLPHEIKHEWLSEGKCNPTHFNTSVRGFHVNQLYSCTVSPAELAASYLRSLSDPSEEQEFYNSKLGLAHTVNGARVTDEDIDQCLGTYKNGTVTPRSIITMGVDVGKFLHYEIDEWFLPDSNSSDNNSLDINVNSLCRVIEIGKLLSFNDLDRLMINSKVQACVIDAHPERRKAFEFASRFPGAVKMCFYGRGINGKQIHENAAGNSTTGYVGSSSAIGEPTITVDRTSWLDLSLGRFRRGKNAIILPYDSNLEYRLHLKALVRLYQKDKEGNPIGRYENANNDDHYAHARNYAEIAYPFALIFNQHQSIPGIL